MMNRVQSFQLAHARQLLSSGPRISVGDGSARSRLCSGGMGPSTVALSGVVATVEPPDASVHGRESGRFCTGLSPRGSS